MTFITCCKDEVRIPNKEIIIKFKGELENAGFGSISVLARNYWELLQATKSLNASFVEKVLEETHEKQKLGILTYNSELSLYYVVRMAYLFADDDYILQREEAMVKTCCL